MECHKCPFREKLEAGEYAQMAYDETPCAKCELNEYSDRTIEFDEERENQTESAVGFSASGSTADMTADMASSAQSAEYFREAIESGQEEELLPLSLMNELVFRLLSMPPDTRDVLCWRFAGIPYRDIAVLQGVTVSAIEKRHWKAMKKWPALRAMFAMKVAKHGRRKPASRSQNSESRMIAKKHKGRRMNREERNG